MRTKVKLYNSDGKSVLLYCSGIRENMQRLLAEQNKQHRAIPEDRWSQRCPGDPAMLSEVVGPCPKDVS